MPHRLRLLAFLLGIALLLPSAALADDDGAGDKPKPAPAADPEADPEAADGEPAEGEPNEGAGEQPAPAAPRGRAVNKAVSPSPTPAGMTFLEGGRVQIGSTREYLDGLLAGRGAQDRKLFLYESPPHAVFLRPFFMGKYEVSNGQYHRHLQDYVVGYDTASGSLANVDEISAHLVMLSKEHQENKHQVVWRQFYFANKDLIWGAFKDRLDEFQVKRPDDSIDETATARKFRFQPLPRTLKLKFYSIRPPQNWPSMDPPEGEFDHPARFVSYNDAERFAEWAGMHLPTEQAWEWAARGPGLPIFPWGDEWPLTEVLANWGGKVTNASYETTTVAVSTRAGSNSEGKLKDDEGRLLPIDGDGRSWCGCHHMVGNVTEWTSSWFEPYPGNKHHQNFMGRWVKVLRGGSCADQSMLVLRPACRNWVGGGPDAPPFPGAYFDWAGFRVASYMKSGRDQLGPILRRTVRHQKVSEDALDLDRFVGSVTRNWVEPGAEPVNHVYVLGRSNSIVIVPLKTFLREHGMEAMKKAWTRPNSLKTARGIAKKASEEHPFWVVGILHSDVRIEPVEVRKVVVVDPKKKKKKKGRRRGRAKAPETQEGSCPPGTYLLGNWFGRLALFSAAKEFVCFLPKADKKQKSFEVTKIEPGGRAEPMLTVDPELDWADFEYAMPLGGKSMSDEVHLVVRGRLQFEVGSLEAAGTWIQEDPARDLTKRLWDEWVAAEAIAAKEREKAGKKKKKKKPEPAKKDDGKKKTKKKDDGKTKKKDDGGGDEK